MKTLRDKTTHGLKWSAIERILTQSVQLVIMLWLAKMLGPKPFGLVGMLTVFIAIAQVFVDSGFSSALIRKVDRTDADMATAFYYNIVVSIILYFILYFSAPWVAEFYAHPELTQLLRVLSVVVLMNSLVLIPRVKLTIEMDFKSQAKISIIGVILSGIVAISLALYGYGVWVLITQTLITAFVNVVMYNVVSPWMPNHRFSYAAFSYLFGYGNKLLLSGLINVTYGNIYPIIIGKQFSAGTVGQYTQANQLASLPAMTATNIIQRVTFPMFSHLQHDDVQMDKIYRSTLTLAALAIFPLMASIAIIATPLLTQILGTQWQMSAQLLSILCVGFMLYPVQAINLNLLQVKARSDIFLKLEIIKKAIGIAFLVVSIPMGVMAMCCGFVITSYIALFLNTYYTGKLTTISMKVQCKDLLPIWLAVITSAFMAFQLSLLSHESPWLQILSAIVLFSSFYMVYLWLFQKKLLIQLLESLQK